MHRGPGAPELVAARELSHKGSPAFAAEAKIYCPIIQFLVQGWERKSLSLPIPAARSKAGSLEPQSLGDRDRGGGSPFLGLTKLSSWGLASPGSPRTIYPFVHLHWIQLSQTCFIL